MTPASRSGAAGVVFRSVVTTAGLLALAYLVWRLRSLIAPVCVGGLLAYICRPLVARLERCRMPRGLAVGLLLLILATITFVGATSIRAVMPSDTEVLGLRVRALYGLDHHYRVLMGLDSSWTGGNTLYRFAHRDLDPVVDRLGQVLALTPEEHAQLAATGEHTGTLALLARRTSGDPQVLAAPATGGDGGGDLEAILSAWMIAPLIFLFLLFDTGHITRGLLRAVPNRLFEPALAVLADVDQALGDYVRGISLECCALGLTVIVFMTIVGVPLKWALAIGTLAGASNLIPYAGFLVALLSGLGYAVLADNVHSLLPLVSPETFPILVVLAVILAEALKNIVYEPIVLGGAVNLHPVVVVLGVVGGAILFGPAGMFLAIPAITIVKVLVVSTARHLKAYGLV